LVGDGLTKAGIQRLHVAAERHVGDAGRRVLRRIDGPLDETVPATRAITTRDLLTFTLGFGWIMDMVTSATPWPVVAAAEKLKLSTIGLRDPYVQPDPDTWIANLGTLPLLAQPGERWLYNTGALEQAADVR
jgi:CubicO group peptidase (beta-lactamase class C family)